LGKITLGSATFEGKLGKWELSGGNSESYLLLPSIVQVDNRIENRSNKKFQNSQFSKLLESSGLKKTRGTIN
jgi:hypothetical protein